MPGIPFFILDDLIEMDRIRAVFIFRAVRFRGEKAALRLIICPRHGNQLPAFIGSLSRRIPGTSLFGNRAAAGSECSAAQDTGGKSRHGLLNQHFPFHGYPPTFVVAIGFIVGHARGKVYKGTPPIFQNGVAELRHSQNSLQKAKFPAKQRKNAALLLRKAAFVENHLL